ncbi:MAG TPA: tRNA (adenosine(37)-N6)-threonylcarbamoyltransferase complex dimerization subunit type 1 TsaB [Acidimicrobiales bacterium]
MAARDRRRRAVGGDPVIVLALESATDLVGAALLGDVPPQPAATETGGRRHAEALAPAVHQVCGDAGVALSAVDVIAVDVGPGLFTGLRVGVATAKALGQGLGIGVVAVGSLDILARAAVERRPGGSPCQVIAVVDARRSEVFAARYRFDGGATSDWDPAGHEVSPPARFEPGALVEDLARMVAGTEPGDEGGAAGPLVLVGDGVARYRDLFDKLNRVETLPGDPLLAPPPETLARLASLRLRRGADPSEPAAVLPSYLREADAAINWEQRAPVAVNGRRTSGSAVAPGRPT